MLIQISLKTPSYLSIKKIIQQREVVVINSTCPTFLFKPSPSRLLHIQKEERSSWFSVSPEPPYSVEQK